MRSTGTGRRGWRRETRTESGRSPSGVAPPDPSAQPAVGRHQRMRAAEAEARAWVVEARGGFDAGSGAMFDERLHGVGIDWHKQDTDEHNNYLSDVGRRIAAATGLVTDAQTAVRQAEEERERAWEDYVTAREKLRDKPSTHTHRSTGETGGNGSAWSHASPRLPTSSDLSPEDQAAPGGAGPTRSGTPTASGPNYRDSALIPGRSRLELLMWLFVLGAVVGDFAAFYGVLARLFRTEPAVVLAGAIGFSAAAIGICHLIGVGLRRKRSVDRHRSDALLWAAMAGWLALGCAAFVARLHYGADPSGATGSASFGSANPIAGADRDLLAAITFAGLYIVSGLLAMTTSYHTFNPAARAYRRALRNLKDATQKVGSAQAQHVEQLGHQKVVEGERSRAPERRKATYRRTEADVVSLKILVRHRMAAELGDPEALDLLMRNAPTVAQYPEPAPYSEAESAS